jgi:hypothetical protein
MFIRLRGVPPGMRDGWFSDMDFFARRFAGSCRAMVRMERASFLR